MRSFWQRRVGQSGQLAHCLALKNPGAQTLPEQSSLAHLSVAAQPESFSAGHALPDMMHPGSNHSQMFDGKALLHGLRKAGFAPPRVSE